MRFHDRSDGGRQLAARLDTYADRRDVLVLALPRGGVPVAFEVASLLHVQLDILIVRKLGVPGEEELALGAIASGGIVVLNEQLVRMLDISQDMLRSIERRENAELERRERVYRGVRPWPLMHDRTAILVDDGIATGATMRAAIEAVRVQHPARIIVAAPVAAADTCALLRREADEVICVLETERLTGVGAWYVDFPQASDAEIRAILARAWQENAHHPS